jgi:hypothetical protein
MPKSNLASRQNSANRPPIPPGSMLEQFRLVEEASKLVRQQQEQEAEVGRKTVQRIDVCIGKSGELFRGILFTTGNETLL